MYALCYYIYIYPHTYSIYHSWSSPKPACTSLEVFWEARKEDRRWTNWTKPRISLLRPVGSISQQTMVDSTKHHLMVTWWSLGFWFHRGRGLCAFLGFMWKNHLKNLYFLEMSYPLFSWVIWILDAFTTPFESLVVQNEIFAGYVWQYVIFCLDIVLCLLNYII